MERSPPFHWDFYIAFTKKVLAKLKDQFAQIKVSIAI